jgi:hypothetical protein
MRTQRDAPRAAGRIGLVARGVVYCVAAVLGVRLVLGAHERVDKEGAIQGVARQPLGVVLLALLLIGFLGYAAWRFARAVTGAPEGGKRKEGAADAGKRALEVGRGLLYIVLAWTTARFILERKQSHAPNETEREWTATLLESSVGRWIVIAAGALLLGIGIWLIVRAFRMKFVEKLDLADAPEELRGPIKAVGAAGYFVRGLVAGAIGWFVFRAAVEFDPNEAVGVDGALKRLLNESWGRPLVLALSAGLLAFGLFSFVEARYRKVLEG